MIIFSNNINTKNIQVQKELIHYDKLHYIPLNYNKEPFVFQINNLYSKFGLNLYNDNKKTIDLFFKKNDEKHNETLPKFNKIFSMIREHLKIKYPKSYLEEILKENNDDTYLRCKIPYYTKIYSQNKVLLSMDDLKPRIFCDCIIHIQGVWIYNENKMWFDISLVQSRLHIPLYVKDYAFIDEPEIKTESTQVLNKYTKMIKMGIPQDAVIFKMESEGIKYKEGMLSKPSKSIKPMRSLLGNSIIKGVNLKKVSKPVKPKSPKNGFEAPTQEELLKILKGLKKI